MLGFRARSLWRISSDLAAVAQLWLRGVGFRVRFLDGSPPTPKRERQGLAGRAIIEGADIL